MAGTTSSGGWAGTTLADRRAARRRALLDVALDLLGTQGAGAVTVRSVCREARLTDRYFYENFPHREALLEAVYDGVAAGAGQVLVDAVAAAGRADEAVVARAAIDAFVDLLTADRRLGRVLLLEPQTDPILGARAAENTPLFAGIIRSQLRDASEQDAQLIATALVGAVAALLVAWLDGSLPVPRTEFTDFCVRLLCSSGSLHGQPAHERG